MLGSILEWFYVAVLGLKVGEDGWRTFTVSPPHTSEFCEVRASFECPYGMIDVHFMREKTGSMALEVTVPMSTEAVVAPPESAKNVEVTRKGGESRCVTGVSTKLAHGSYTIRIS